MSKPTESSTEKYQWLKTQLFVDKIEIEPLQGDASFRRYFRVKTPKESYILMEVPPEEKCLDSFIFIDQRLIAHGLTAPHLFFVHPEHGWVLLSDFGDQLLYHEIKSLQKTPEATKKIAAYYQALLTPLTIFQYIEHKDLPSFNKEHSLHELALFSEWFLPYFLNITLSAQDKMQLQCCFETISSRISAQPCCFIHRDFHSKNLMLLKDNSIGILDFQDAMSGPMLYDLVSLLTDAYVYLPPAFQMQMLRQFYDKLFGVSESLLHNLPCLDTLITDFYLLGLQRHLKILGIFTRLAIRDRKKNYLQYIPQILRHVIGTLEYCGLSNKQNALLLQLCHLPDHAIK